MSMIPEEFLEHLEDAPKPEIDEDAILAEKLRDAQEAPGYPVEFDPREARLAGAFIDGAVSDEDAEAAAIDAI